MKVEVGQWWQFVAGDLQWQPWDKANRIINKMNRFDPNLQFGYFNLTVSPIMDITDGEPTFPEHWKFIGWSCEFCGQLCNQGCDKNKLSSFL